MTGDLEQYQNDRPAWLADTAPKQAARIACDTYDDTVLAATWHGMQRDYQKAVWNLLPESARERIKRVRG